METGSRYYGEEIMNRKVRKSKGTIGTVIPNRKIVFHFIFPVTLVSPYFEWRIEPKGENSVFTAIITIRCTSVHSFHGYMSILNIFFSPISIVVNPPS